MSATPDPMPTGAPPEGRRPVLDLDPDVGDPPPGNRAVADDELAELLESMRREGQLVSGIASRHPTEPGRHIRAAGNRRARCCQLLGIPWRAEFIDRVLTPRELIRIRVGENVHRKNPSPFELCEDVTAMMREGGFGTWAEVAAELALSPATISRITTVRRYTPEQRERAKLVVPTVCWLIAPLMPQERERALAYATTPDERGALPTKDQVTLFIKREIKGQRRRGRGPRALKGKFDGRAFQIQLKDRDEAGALAEWLKALGARVAKGGQELPLEGVAFLFR